MIPRTVLTLHTDWQEELRHLITSTEELFALLNLDTEALPSAIEASRHFPIRVPRPYAARIQKGDPFDPLLLQVLPLGVELMTAHGFTTDPVGDVGANVIPGLLHKYKGRVLLIASGHCAINCRYCFRRNFDYDANKPGRLEWEQALTYIAKDTSISEVILSGGDPLVSNNKQLAWLIDKLSGIPHVTRLRIHTRLPIVIPSRIDNTLLGILTDTKLTIAFVIHCNHANEIDTQVADCLKKLKLIPNLTLLNQSVLLKGVNDCAQTLIDLSQTLFAAGVLPYYLHMLDKVQGSAHFAVSDEYAHELMQILMSRLPGYLVPKLVREETGRPYKTPFILKA